MGSHTAAGGKRGQAATLDLMGGVDGEGDDHTDDEASNFVTQDSRPTSPLLKADLYLDPEVAAKRLPLVDDLLEQYSKDSARLSGTVKELMNSLEFSQKEIADLKEENASVKVIIGNLDTEDKPTQFQIKDVEDKLDKLDSITKKKNLVFEGIPEEA